jgi:hypothetical protein
MARRAITLTIVPHALFEALQFTLSLQPVGPGQQIAQRDIINAWKTLWMLVGSA